MHSHATPEFSFSSSSSVLLCALRRAVKLQRLGGLHVSRAKRLDRSLCPRRLRYWGCPLRALLELARAVAVVQPRSSFRLALWLVSLRPLAHRRVSSPTRVLPSRRESSQTPTRRRSEDAISFGACLWVCESM